MVWSLPLNGNKLADTKPQKVFVKKLPFYADNLHYIDGQKWTITGVNNLMSAGLHLCLSTTWKSYGGFREFELKDNFISAAYSDYKLSKVGNAPSTVLMLEKKDRVSVVTSIKKREVVRIKKK